MQGDISFSQLLTNMWGSLGVSINIGHGLAEHFLIANVHLNQQTQLQDKKNCEVFDQVKH